MKARTEQGLRIRIDQLEEALYEGQERVAISVPLEAEEAYNELKNQTILYRSQLALWMRLYERERQAYVALSRERSKRLKHSRDKIR